MLAVGDRPYASPFQCSGELFWLCSNAIYFKSLFPEVYVLEAGRVRCHLKWLRSKLGTHIFYVQLKKAYSLIYPKPPLVPTVLVCYGRICWIVPRPATDSDRNRCTLYDSTVFVKYPPLDRTKLRIVIYTAMILYHKHPCRHLPRDIDRELVVHPLLIFLMNSQDIGACCLGTNQSRIMANFPYTIEIHAINSLNIPTQISALACCQAGAVSSEVWIDWGGAVWESAWESVPGR